MLHALVIFRACMEIVTVRSNVSHYVLTVERLAWLLGAPCPGTCAAIAAIAADDTMLSTLAVACQDNGVALVNYSVSTLAVACQDNGVALVNCSGKVSSFGVMLPALQGSWKGWQTSALVDPAKASCC